MKKIIHRNKVPPGGYFAWKCPKHGTLIRKPSMMRVEMAVRDYTKANGMPMPNRDELDANVCEQMPHICYDNEAPPLMRQAYNAAMELGKWAAHKFEVASEEVVKQRLDICQGTGTVPKCNYWSGLVGGNMVSGRCGRCGCSGLKLKMATTRCPIGKW